jgi:hypothetical protein
MRVRLYCYEEVLLIAGELESMKVLINVDYILHDCEEIVGLVLIP